MKENSNNKSLIKVNNNIFYKIRNWFINLFRFENRNTEDNNELINSDIEIFNSNSKNDFLNSLKILENDDINIFNLQRQYENGKLSIQNMTKEEYSKIVELYNRQIQELENKLKKQKAKLSTN